MLADRDLNSARETAEMIAREGGVAECVAADWTRAADCRTIASACREAWGRIDFLQNNVGIGTGDAGPLELTERAFDRIIAVNLKGCLLSCQAVVPVMREQGSGSIVNISSIAALAAAVPLTAYRISKVGVNVLSHSLALDQRAARRPRKHDHARAARHADGDRRVGGKARGFARADPRRARRVRPTPSEDGHRLGCRLRQPVSAHRRGGIHHRRGSTG
jgi:NAD(P)-dependent dehydrogenase (short-subunit alcohol dehydrogenase family)